MDDEVIILSIQTGEAVKNIGELKYNIDKYKEALEKAEIGGEDYNNILIALQTNQAALKNAMHATTTDANAQAVSMEDVAKAATGAGSSYNALVRQMAMLDQEFRATEDVAKRDLLGAQIKNINAQLKEMDEQRGKFGRNVGNYKSAIEGMAGAFKATAGQAGSVIPKVQGVTAGFKAMSATPVIAILGLLVNVLSKVMSGLKSSETNTLAMKQALSVFQPIINATTKAVQKLGEWLVKVVEWAGKAARWLGLVKGDAADAMAELTRRENELLKDQRAMKVEEAKINAEIAELQRKAADKTHETAKAREKYAQEAQAKEDALFEKKYELAQREFDLLKQRAELTGNSTAENDKLAEAEARLYQLQEERSNRQRSIQRQENTAHKELQRAANDTAAAETEAAKQTLVGWDELSKAMEAGEKKRQEAREATAKQYAELDALLAESDKTLTEGIQSELDAQLSAEWDALQEEKRIKEQRMGLMFDFAAGVANLAGSLADIYEANGEADEKSAKKAKALRIAESIINTISGAVAAFTGTIKSIPGPAGIALAAVNSAAVLAAGYANVRKIQQQKVGSGGDGGGASVPAIATAPSTPASIRQVRTITGATEEQRLNAMAGDQRVYLVYSDVEAAARSQRVKVQETSW